MKKKTIDPEEKKFRRKMRNRKTRLYLVMVVFSLFVLAFSALMFINSDLKRLRPQVNRAVKQLSEILPRLESNEAALRGAYDQMADSLEKILTSDVLAGKGYAVERGGLEEMIVTNLSWMDSVTNLKVGREGYMFVVDKSTSRIIAHPNKAAVGRKYFPYENFRADEIVHLDSITSDVAADSLNLSLCIMDPQKYADAPAGSLEEALENIRMTIIGVVVDYGDVYIACGIPITELLADVGTKSLWFSVFFIIFSWLFVKWICLVTASRRETVKSFRTKLISYAVISCLSLFGVSLFTQSLADVTNDLKTMEKHATAAVDNLNHFQEQSELINAWLDTFYVYETLVSARIVELKGKENLTRADLQGYADSLNLMYIYLFDQQGNVVVTNSPYDHLTLSEDPDDPTYQMRALLDGVAGTITRPFRDDKSNEEIQLIGVSLRNSDDLCDGFVMVTVDTLLRNSLLAPLTVNTVIDNMVIGLPDYAIAVDKETHDIVATTGLGYVGESADDLGLKVKDLEGNFSGFFRYDGTMHYVGLGETSDMYLIPIVRRYGGVERFNVALRLVLFAACAMAVYIILALFRYQRDVIDSAPASEPEAHEEDKTEEVQDDEMQHGILFGLSNLIHVEKKKGLDERWHMKRVPKDKQTPEQRIMRIIYWLMLVFCFAILFPTLYVSLDHGSGLRKAGSLAYIVSGNWHKGFNIFSITYCLFLFCAMNVVVVLLEHILYLIARISGMRTETVCLLIRNSLKYICVIVFIYVGLSKFGVDTKTLLASAGILTLMISLGAKDLVSDIIAGFFIILEGSYKVGDFISVGGWIGTVVEIGLRTTRVRFYSDTKIFNNSSLRDLVNSDGPVARMVLSMPIGYDENLEKIEAILAEELPKMKDDIPGLVRGPEYEGVDSFESSCVMLRIVIYMETPFRYAAFRRLKRDMKLMFDRRGIQIPFNQVVVHEAKDPGIDS